MSAKFNEQDRNWLKSMLYQGQVNQFEEALMMSAFDQETDFDIDEIEKAMKAEKLLKRICLYKLIVYPLELVVIRLLLGASKAEDHSRLTSLYRQYYRKKLTLEAFRIKLQAFYKEKPIV